MRVDCYSCLACAISNLLTKCLDIAMSSEHVDKYVKDGMRMTSHRQIIFNVIEGSKDHPDVDHHLELYCRKLKI